MVYCVIFLLVFLYFSLLLVVEFAFATCHHKTFPNPIFNLVANSTIYVCEFDRTWCFLVELFIYVRQNTSIGKSRYTFKDSFSRLKIHSSKIWICLSFLFLNVFKVIVTTTQYNGTSEVGTSEVREDSVYYRPYL